MIKSFLIIVSFTILLFANRQIILVVSEETNSSQANLECYENDRLVFQAITVNLGAKGMGIGVGEYELPQHKGIGLKYEGDKKAPMGIFQLTSVFGYTQNNDFHMPYLQTSKNLICVDDSDSKDYNKIISLSMKPPQSYEIMKRDDQQYELGIVVGHNLQQRKKRGSCIFIHVQKKENAPTVGCTSMKLQDLEKITSWLESEKNPLLIQIPKSYAKEILKLYPELKSSKLLN